MKILWLTNQPLRAITDKLHLKVGFGGGWMDLLSKQVAEKEQLFVLFPYSKDIDANEVDGYSFQGFAFQKKTAKVNREVLEKIKHILSNFSPDVIHIWGTEYLHSFLCVCAAEELNVSDRVVISIQGLVSVYYKHFWAYINDNSIRKPTFKERIKRGGLYKEAEFFKKRGYFETESIRKIRHVIGRTDWDKACTNQINNNLIYHFCNETLRETFYNKTWRIEECEKHSVFVSQSQYPIKGFHQVIRAVAILKDKYPDIKVYSTGNRNIKPGFKDRILESGYDRYLRNLIIELNVLNNIAYVGMLDEEEMCKQYLKSHVFVSASSIENSPNSVGEAMMLGMPVVSSDVGGVKNMIQHEQEGFIYQADAPYMLAYYIDKFFSDNILAERIGRSAKKHASITHDPIRNINKLLEIYKEICERKD